METTLRDIRYGLRMLRKNFGFTVVAVIALMLGIASTTVIFSVINGVLLRPLPYPDAERIVTIDQKIRTTGASRDAVSPANFLDWQKQNDVFVAMAASRGWQGNLSDGDAPERLRVTMMTASFSPDDYGELWVPSAFGVPTHSLRPTQDPRQIRDSNYLDVYARVKPGVTLQQAQAQMSAIMARLEKDYPDDNMDEDIVIT